MKLPRAEAPRGTPGDSLANIINERRASEAQQAAAAQQSAKDAQYEACKANGWSTPSCRKLRDQIDKENGLKPKPKRSLAGRIQNEIQWASGALSNEAEFRGKQLEAAVTGSSIKEVEKKREVRKEKRKRLEEKHPTLFHNEGASIALGAASDIAEGGVNLVKLGADAVGVGFAKIRGRGDAVDPRDNPFSPEYQEAFGNDFGPEARTAAGRVTQTLLTYGGLTAGIARKLPKNIIKGGKPERIIRTLMDGAQAGALADFMLTRKGEDNLGNMVAELTGNPADAGILKYWATQEDENAVTSRVKAVVEGGVVGGVLAGSAVGIGRALTAAGHPQLGSTVAGLFAGQQETAKAIKEGVSEPEAVARGIQKAAETTEAVSIKLAEDAEREAIRWATLNVEKTDQLRAKLEALEVRLAESPDDVNLKGEVDATRSELKTSEEVTEAAQMEAELASENTYLAMEAEASKAEAPKADAPEAPKTDAPEPDSKGEVWGKTEGAENIRRVRPEKAKTKPQMLDDLKRQLNESQTKEALGYNPADSSRLPQERAATMSPDYRKGVMTDAQKAILINQTEMDEAPTFIEEAIKETAVDLSVDADKEVVERAAKWFNRYNTEATEQGTSLADFVAANRSDPELFDGENLTNAGVVFARRTIVQAADDSAEFADKALKLLENGEELGNIPERLMDTMVYSMQMLQAAGKKYGRGLRSFQLKWNDDGGDVLSEQFAQSVAQDKKALEVIGGLALKMSQEGPDRVKALREFRSITAGIALSGKKGGPDLQFNMMKHLRAHAGDNLQTMMLQSMFSGPMTQVRAFLGGVAVAVERPTSYAVAATGRGDIDDLARGAAMLFRTVSEYQTHLAAFVRGWNGKPKLANGGEKYFGKLQAKRGEYVDALKHASTPAEKALAQMNLMAYDILQNPLFNWPMQGLMGGDEMFQSFNRSLHRKLVSLEEAKRAVAEKGGSIDELFKAADSRNARLWELDVEKYGGKDIKEWIAASTFQAEPDAFIRSVTNVLNNTWLGRKFVPVVNTPWQILKYVGGSSPLGRFGNRFKELETRRLAGVLSPHEHVELVSLQGRQALGTLAMLTGWGVAVSLGEENFTGFGPRPGSAEWQQWQAMGIQPQSIRMPDGTWFSYRDYEPFATIFGIAGDIPRWSSALGEEGISAAGVMMASTAAAAITDKTMMTGLADLAELGANPSPDMLARTFLQMGVSHIPYGSMRNQIANEIQPYRQNVTDASQRLLFGNAAGASGKQGGHLDTLINPYTGQPIPHGRSIIRSAAKFFGMETDVDREADPGRATDFYMMTMLEVGFNVNRNINTIDGAPANAYMQTKLQQTMYDLGYPQAMQEVIDSPEFVEQLRVEENMSAEERRTIRDLNLETSAGSTVGMLNRVHNRIKNQAIKRLQESDPEFMASKGMREEARQRSLAAPATRVPEPKEVESLIGQLGL